MALSYLITMTALLGLAYCAPTETEDKTEDIPETEAAAYLQNFARSDTYMICTLEYMKDMGGGYGRGGSGSDKSQVGDSSVGENVKGNVYTSEKNNNDDDFLQCAEHAWQEYKKNNGDDKFDYGTYNSIPWNYINYSPNNNNNNGYSNNYGVYSNIPGNHNIYDTNNNNGYSNNYGVYSNIPGNPNIYGMNNNNGYGNNYGVYSNIPGNHNIYGMNNNNGYSNNYGVYSNIPWNYINYGPNNNNGYSNNNKYTKCHQRQIQSDAEIGGFNVGVAC